MHPSKYVYSVLMEMLECYGPWLTSSAADVTQQQLHQVLVATLLPLVEQSLVPSIILIATITTTRKRINNVMQMHFK